MLFRYKSNQVYTRFMIRKGYVNYFLLAIVSLIFCADLLLHPGRSITFDGHVHITTIAQFYNALKDGEFPVTWANGFANYGLPIPLVAHQTTSYLGAFFQFFTHNPVQAYNLVMLLGIFLSSAFFYRFLRYHFSDNYSLVSAIVFTFAPYRITNAYIRGALPELFGAVFLPVVLIGVYQVVKEQKRIGLLWITLGTLFLALTHPMMLVLSGLVIVPYALYLLWPVQKHWRQVVIIVVAASLGLLIAGYYLVPLLVEIKYFSYGTTSDHFRPQGGFLQFPDYFIDNWMYFGPEHPGPRANTLTMGSIESLIVTLGFLVFAFQYRKGKKKSLRDTQLLPWLVMAVSGVFLMTTWSTQLYRVIFVLNNVQYPWRMLSGLMFVSPFILAWLLAKINRPHLGFLIVLLVVIIRFPQLYGKNFMKYDLKNYDFTTANLHTDNMNTLWMGNSREYPTKTKQFEIIGGEGSVTPEVLKNASRTYRIQAREPIRMFDATFYFPGWKVYVDGQPTEIEFQDPNYRGLITYHVPAGDHEVRVRFEPTKIRILGMLVTGAGVVGTMGLFWALRVKKVRELVLLK